MTVRKQTSIVFSFLKLKQTETVRNKFAGGVRSRQQVHYARRVLRATRLLAQLPRPRADSFLFLNRNRLKTVRSKFAIVLCFAMPNQTEICPK
jgi:hypothetical protein